jgi:DNA-binding CsgD family transcriptional regulator
LIPMAEAELASGDLATARRRADEALTHTLETGYHAIAAHVTSARISSAQDDEERAERDAHDALACSGGHTYLGLPDALERIAKIAADAGRHQEAARLYGAADALRQRNGEIRFALHQGGYEASLATLRASMTDDDYASAWAEGTALSADEAVAYAQRGRGKRKRPASGWASLTPTEHDVVRLVGEGLANREIATRLFVSPRTVQSHLTHVYTKLGVTSRVQLAQKATRHA